MSAKKGIAEPARRSDFEEALDFRVDGKDLGQDNSLIYEEFPEDVANFFFFDGETITRYAEAQENNRETVEKALGLPYLRLETGYAPSDSARRHREQGSLLAERPP